MNYTEVMTREKDRNPEEEIRLWQQFTLNGSSDLYRMQVVEYYLPLVIKVARSMSEAIRNRISIDELVSIGVIGLHNAIDAFASDRNILFSTFAFKRIRGAIFDELRRQDVLTRTQRNCYRDICEAIARLTQEFSRPPTDEELADDTGLTVGEIERYIGMGTETVNLDEEFQEGINYLDVIPDDSGLAPDELTHQLMAVEKLHEHFHELTDREQKILYLRFFEEMSVKEVAEVMEISEGRISQIFQKVLIKLRALMKIETGGRS